jgi:putative hemolysin
MPADFTRCVSQGGKVRTKKLSNGRYLHICYLNGKSYPGEIKKKKGK